MKSSEYLEYYHKEKKYANKKIFKILKYSYNKRLIRQHLKKMSKNKFLD